jgi:hypothetical protein
VTIFLAKHNGKTINVESLPPEAWKVVLGHEPGEAGEAGISLHDAYARVSWAFRAVDILSENLRAVPFQIFRDGADKPLDDSDDYQNALGFLPDPGALFGLIESALAVFGYGYLYKRPNSINTKPFELRYMLPTSVRPDWKKNDQGAVVDIGSWKRGNETLKVEDVIYFWSPDPFVELGPPTSSPLQSALSEAGVIYNLNQFMTQHLQRGAVKATILEVEGNPPPAEKSRIEELWDRLFRRGPKNLGRALVVNKAGLNPVVIGDGLEALKDNGLTQDKREAISTALGIPHSILFSGAANYAVSQQDEINLYRQKVIPDCRFIQDVLNHQLLIPLGYRIEFQWQRLSIFQEDEEQRSASLASFIGAINQAGSIELAKAAFEIYGFDIPDEAMTLIEQHYAASEKRREETQAQFAEKPADDEREEMEQKPPSGRPTRRTDLDRWMDKALKAVKAGKPAAVTFDSDEIGPALRGSITGALEAAKSADDVRAAFAAIWAGYP